eukprot:g48167.t1
MHRSPDDEINTAYRATEKQLAHGFTRPEITFYLTDPLDPTPAYSDIIKLYCITSAKGNYLPNQNKYSPGLAISQAVTRVITLSILDGSAQRNTHCRLLAHQAQCTLIIVSFSIFLH